MYTGKTILITGGTGSFGQNFAEFLLKKHKPKKVIIFSRDELKQFQMQQKFAGEKRLRFFIGDIRDLSRLERAFAGVDIVVHAAALKQVPALEYNPTEAVKTNIQGSQNVIDAALTCGVSKVLLISTDKAVNPINLYGATKMCAEKLFVSSNAYSGDRSTKLSAVRYGNVIGSRGSIVETIIYGDQKKPLTLTHEDMTRFWLSLDQCFDLVTFALMNMEGGEIIVPKAPSMKVVDLFKALAPSRKIQTVGIRPGEKMHEVLISEDESSRTRYLGKYFMIVNQFASEVVLKKIASKGKKCKPGFIYASDTNKEWLDAKGLHKLLKR